MSRRHPKAAKPWWPFVVCGGIIAALAIAYAISQAEELPYQTHVPGAASDGVLPEPTPTPTPTLSPTPAPSSEPGLNLPAYWGALTEYDVRALLAAAGWWGWPLEEALVITHCESTWNTGAVGWAGEVGLFQIHPINWARAYALGYDVFDPLENAAFALVMYSEAGWQPWSCHVRLY